MFNHFPSIESFHHIRKFALKYPEHVPNTVNYRGKVKLHGTNAGVIVTADRVVAQSRSRVITVDDDNAGFAKWVAENEGYFRSLHAGEDFTIFGEWAGPGIQKGVACTQVPQKFFAVFMVQYGRSDDEAARVVTEPKEIYGAMSGDGYTHPADIRIIPWETSSLPVNFFSAESCANAVNIINESVLSVEHEDPFIKRNFGISGVGEGLVYYPINTNSRLTVSNLMFKAKGEKHKGVKDYKPAQIDVAAVTAATEFAVMFVTPARCEQAIAEACGGDADMRNIGSFLKWIMQDVEKESQAELEDGGLEWKQVAKSVQAAAKQWFIGQSRMDVAAE